LEIEDFAAGRGASLGGGLAEVPHATSPFVEETPGTEAANLGERLEQGVPQQSGGGIDVGMRGGGRFRHDVIDQSQAVTLAGRDPAGRGAHPLRYANSLRGDRAVDGMLEHQHPVADPERECRSASRLADYGGHDGDGQEADQTESLADRGAETVGRTARAVGGAGRIDKDHNR